MAGGHILDMQFPEVNPSGATSAGRMDIRTSPAMFGGAGAQAEEAFGQSAEKAGETGLDVITARQHLTNEIHASEVNTWLADQITDKHAKFGQLEGRAALDALPQYKQDIEGLYQDSMAKTGSLQERAMLARTGRQLTSRYYGYATQHADGQWRKWADETAKRRADTFGQQAGIAAANNDDTGMTTFLNTSDDEVRKLSEQKGFDTEATDSVVLKNRGANLKRIIESRIDESPVAASAMYRKYEHQMDAASSLEVRNKLRGALSQVQGRDLADEETGRITPQGAAPVADVPASFLGAIKRSEGYKEKAYWDFAQHSIGYGTKANSPTETITREEADRRFNSEIEKAAKFVDDVNPHLDPGTRAALVSLTYNTGPAWTNASLGEKIRAGDVDGARAAFKKYVNAGGAPLPALIERRYAEASWFGQNAAPAGSLPDKAEAFERIVARTRDNPLVQNAALARMNQIYAVYRQEAVANTAAFKSRIDNSLAEAGATGSVKTPIEEDEFVAHLGAERGLAAKQEYDQALQLSGDIHAMASMGPDEIEALRNRWTPQPGQEDYATAAKRADAIDKAARQLAAERTKDPAGYGIKYLPAVREGYEKMSEALADPKVPLPAKQAAVRDFAQRQLLEQERIGIPPESQRVVTKDYTTSLAARLNSAGAAGASGRLNDEIKAAATLWGEHWPRIYQEVSKTATPLVRVIGSGVQDTAAKRLIDSYGIDEKDIVALQHDTTRKSIDNGVADELKSFAGTLSGSDRDRTLRDITSTARRLAALYVTDGSDAGTAARDAVNQIVNFKYDYKGGLRIPKLTETGAPAPWSADDVVAGAQALKNGLSVPAASSLGEARRDLKLNPQEEALYQRHLGNLTGPGGVDNKDGSRSTLYQVTAQFGDRTYVLPTVYDGKILAAPDAVARARREGLDKFPSYASEAEASARYDKMHGYMERDTAKFLQARKDNPQSGISLDLMPPRHVDDGTSRAQQYDAMVKAVRRDGRWITAPNESGLALVFDKTPVLGRDGKPIIVPWDKLAPAGQAANKATAAALTEANRTIVP